MEKDKKSESNRKAWLLALEVKKFDAEWQKKLNEIDKGLQFRQSSLLALNQQRLSFAKVWLIPVSAELN